MSAARHNEDDEINEQINGRIAEIALRVITARLARRGFSGLADDRAIRDTVRRLGRPPDSSENQTQSLTGTEPFAEAGVAVADVAATVTRIARGTTAEIMKKIEVEAAAQGIRLSAPEKVRSAVFAAAAKCLADEIERRLITHAAGSAAAGSRPTVKSTDRK